MPFSIITNDLLYNIDSPIPFLMFSGIEVFVNKSARL